MTTQPELTKVKPIKLLSRTNDHHGHFWRSEYGEYGLAAQKRWWTVSVRWRKRVLLSGGDINTGVPGIRLRDAEPDSAG